MCFPAITEENKTIWLLSSEMVVREGHKLLLVWKSSSSTFTFLYMKKEFSYKTLEVKMGTSSILLHT